ncbi:MAG: GTPase HflX, partial [Tetrasphaera sp.]|nr:GTPase HflX [Tetrasphaera sp.]
MTEPLDDLRGDDADDILARPAEALAGTTYDHDDRDGDQFDREERAALQRVEGLSTELEDITEVEYR